MKIPKKEKNFDVQLLESQGNAREDYLSSLRENVRSYMRECGYTIDELAEIADIPVGTFNDFLYGRTTTVKITPIIRLAKEFGVSIDELIGSDTLPRETKESLQILRRLPEHFRYFMRWNIRETEKQRKAIGPKYKAVNLIRPICYHGGFKPTETFEVLDISHVDHTIRPRVFMALKIPCEHYMPTYSPYHVLLIANDRNPRPNEHCLVIGSKLMWLVTIKDGKCYSLRDGKYRCDLSDVELVGYVAATKMIDG
jgi:transcriptional regulator with XRE-family HTH domain